MATTRTSTGPWFAVLLIGAIVVVVTLVLISITVVSATFGRAEKAKKVAAASSATVPDLPPWCDPEQLRTYTTPVTLDLAFRVKMKTEGGQQVDIRYVGETTVVHFNPDQGRQVAPVPRGTEKVFVDPRDPENGHIRFWLCPID